jgi:hypothetical protein
MFIRAKVAFETPTHNVAAGQLCELPDHQAVKAIAEGKCVEACLDDQIREMGGGVAVATTTADVERAVAAPMKRRP